MTDDTRLIAALTVIQERGAIGERSLADAVAHADRFVDLVPLGRHSLVDLGSGGGLPALVIAWRRADVSVTMIERRASRADLLLRAIASLDLGRRAVVLNQDVSGVCDVPGVGFDVVTARSFADVATTVRFVDRLLLERGSALVSEPPVDRSATWSTVLDRYPTLLDDGVHQGIRVLRRR